MTKLILTFAISAVLSSAATFTGVITDSMCLNDHKAMNMGPDPECVKACVKSGNVKYVLFDAPGVDGPFEERQRLLNVMLQEHQPEYAKVLYQARCADIDDLKTELARIESLGGEGLMLRQPGSRYEAGRSSTLLKV